MKSSGVKWFHITNLVYETKNRNHMLQNIKLNNDHLTLSVNIEYRNK